jgi:hypothetical protein
LPSGQKSFNLSIPSNFRSLRSIIAVARKQDIESDFEASNTNITFDNLGGKGLKFNLRVNGFQLFQEDLDSPDLLFDQCRRVFGDKLLESEYFRLGTEYTDDKFILCAQTNSLGGSVDSFVTGAATNQHVSSLSLHIECPQLLSQALRMDLFLAYDKLLSVANSRLQIIQ